MVSCGSGEITLLTAAGSLVDDVLVSSLGSPRTLVESFTMLCLLQPLRLVYAEYVFDIAALLLLPAERLCARQDPTARPPLGTAHSHCLACMSHLAMDLCVRLPAFLRMLLLMMHCDALLACSCCMFCG